MSAADKAKLDGVDDGASATPLMDFDRGMENQSEKGAWSFEDIAFSIGDLSRGLFRQPMFVVTSIKSNSGGPIGVVEASEWPWPDYAYNGPAVIAVSSNAVDGQDDLQLYAIDINGTGYRFRPINPVAGSVGQGNPTMPPIKTNSYYAVMLDADNSIAWLDADVWGGGGYVLPVATEETLGGVTVSETAEFTTGAGVNANAAGQLWVPMASSTGAGVMRPGTGLAVSGGKVNLQVASQGSIGGVKAGSGSSDTQMPLKIDADGSAWTELPIADATTYGIIRLGEGLRVNYSTGSVDVAYSMSFNSATGTLSITTEG